MSISFFFFFFLPFIFLLQNLNCTLDTSFSYSQFFYAMNNVLNDNLIHFYFVNYCYKYKKLDCQEEIQRKIIRIKGKKRNSKYC